MGILWPPMLICGILQLAFLTLPTIMVSAQLSTETCLPSSVANNISFSIQSCESIWSEYSANLGFSQNTVDNTLSVVFSVPKSNRWFGFGFNSVPYMVGTSAVIGWVNETTGESRIGTYYLTTTEGSGVTRESSRIIYKTEPTLWDEDDIYYFTFEVNLTASRISTSNNILALSNDGAIPQDTGFTNNDPEHQDVLTTRIDYQSGTIQVVSNDLSKRATAHGILNIVGWGIVLPVGMIIARYAKSYDPAWFYLHGIFQVAGFGFIIAGLVTGIDVHNRVPPNIDDDGHRALGVVIFAVACWQVTAFLLRPKKDSKIRRFWNWGHWWLGRLALLLGAINIFYGIHVANAENKWKIAYGIIVAIIVIVMVIAETLRLINRLKNRRDGQAPQVAMSGTNAHRNGRNSHPSRTVPSPYGNTTQWDQP